MELADLFPVSQELAITLPDGSPTDIKLQVLPTDSTPFQNVVKRHMQASRDRETPMTVEEDAKRNSELLAACVVGWSGLTDKGAPLPYSHEKAAELMATPELNFIREQLEGFASRRAQFFRKGAATA